MKLRIAKKILNCVGTGRIDCYTRGQVTAALARDAKTASSKAADQCWHGLMRHLGAEGRADLFVGWGMPATALRILVEQTP
jgi:hypothetical protein